MSNIEIVVRKICYDVQLIDEYILYLRHQLNEQPKNIWDLMAKYKNCWESRPACEAIERLVSNGEAEEKFRTGNLFQHRYFVARNTNEI